MIFSVPEKFYRAFFVLAHEGELKGEYEIRDNTGGPDVAFAVVEFLGQNFRCDIIRRSHAAFDLPGLRIDFGGQSEIYYLDVAEILADSGSIGLALFARQIDLSFEHEVRSLHVPMNDPCYVVAIGNPIQYVSNHPRRVFVRKVEPLLLHREYELVQLAPFKELGDDVYLVDVFERLLEV